MFLYHYYDASVGPFKNLSDASVEEAESILKDIASKKSNTMCAIDISEFDVSTISFT